MIVVPVADFMAKGPDEAALLKNRRPGLSGRCVVSRLFSGKKSVEMLA
jgi:hypothetical protein